MREKEVEQKLVKAVKLAGGFCIKFTSPGFDGVPDRLVLLPKGRIAFIELKAPGKKPRALQKRRMKFEGFALLFLVFALTAALFSTLFIRTMNNSLIMKIEDIEKETANLITENDKLNLEIQNLISKDRVYDIATNGGLEQNQDNVINVVKGE